MFTDLVDSTGFKGRLTTAGYLPLLRRHDALLREAVASAGGRLQQDTGDGCFALFATSSDATRAALTFQWNMSAEPWPEGCRLAARVGIHLGEVAETEVQQDGGPKLVGFALDLAARVMSVSRGGQILLTRSAFNDARQFLAAHPVAENTPLKWLAHGPYFFKGSEEPLEVFEVGIENQPEFGPPDNSEKARRVLRPGEEQTLGWRPAVGLPMPNNPQWMVEEKIGEGGFGEVWIARHAKIKTRRVFKFCFDPERLRALKREVVLFRLLKETVGDRRDISRVIDWRFDEPPYFIEMDYASAGNLADWAAKQGGIDKIPLANRLKIVAQIARALSAAHSAGILHKDIKPSNVLMEQDASGDYYPRLSDFGIGILTDRGRLKDLNITAAGFTHSNLTLNDSSRTGTRMYTPPECLADKPHTIQGDVYALGVLLNQMIVGDLSRPLGAGWERSVIEVDELLREDVAACVDVDPAVRLSSVAALAERLETLETRREERQRIALQAANQRLAERRRARVRALCVWAALAFLAATVLAIALLLREAQLQRAEAVKQTRIANSNAQEAKLQSIEAMKQTKIAIASARGAKLRRAEGLVSEGDAFRLSGRIVEARRRYWQSFDEFTTLSDSCFLSETGLCVAYAASPPPLLTLNGHIDGVTGVSVSPDGRTAISVGKDKTLILWDVQSGRTIRTLKGHAESVCCVAFGPDGRTAVSGSEDNTLKLWDLESGKLIRTLAGHTAAVRSVAVSSDGLTALSGSADGTLRLWKLQDGSTTLLGHDIDAVNCVALSPDGQFALSGGEEGIVRRWDLQTHKEMPKLEGHTGSVNSVAFGPDGTTALSGGWDKTVKLWNLTTGKEIRSLIGHTEPVMAVAFSPDGRTALSGSSDRTLKLWDLDAGKEISSFAGHTKAVSSVAFAPDGRTALSASEDKTLKLWDLDDAREIETIHGHAGPVAAVAFGPDGRIAVSGSHDTTVKVWDLPTGKALRSIGGHSQEVSSVAVSPDGRSVLSGSWDSTIKLSDLQTGNVISTLNGHVDWVRSVAFSPDGRSALSGSSDRTVKFWDLKSGRAIQTLKDDHMAEVTSAVFSADGGAALSGSADGMLRIWDLHTGSKTRTLDGSNHVADTIAVSPDGLTALAGSADNTVEVWDLQAGTLLRTLEGHTGWVSSVAFSPDGHIGVSGSADNTLKLWGLQEGEEIRTLSGHTTAILSAVFSPDGGAILTGGFDGTIRLWNFSRIADYRNFDQKVEQARLTLSTKPNDLEAIGVLGEWYAFRGKNDWAVELLEKAHAGGASVNPLTLARCYWEMSDDIPPKTNKTRLDYLNAAQAEYASALAAAKDEKERFYLGLCLTAVRRNATMPPTTAPAPAN